MAILHIRSDLSGLRKWANRKKLDGQHQVYQQQLKTTHKIISFFRKHHPHLAFWGTLIYHLNNIINPSRIFPKKGSASGYRLRNWEFVQVGSVESDVLWLVRFSGREIFGRRSSWLI